MWWSGKSKKDKIIKIDERSFERLKLARIYVWDSFEIKFICPQSFIRPIQFLYAAWFNFIKNFPTIHYLESRILIHLKYPIFNFKKKIIFIKFLKIPSFDHPLRSSKIFNPPLDILDSTFSLSPFFTRKFAKISQNFFSPPLIKPSNLLHRKLYPHPLEPCPTSRNTNFQHFRVLPRKFSTRVKRRCTTKETREHKRKLRPNPPRRKRWERTVSETRSLQNFPNDIRERLRLSVSRLKKKRRKKKGERRRERKFLYPGNRGQCGKINSRNICGQHN